MARRPARGGRTERQPTAKSRKPAAAEVEVVEESDSGSLDASIAIVTTIMLVVALLLVDALRAKFGDGLFL